MAPAAVLINPTSDFEPSTTTSKTTMASATQRTLLLSPPSASAHEEKLRALFATYNRSNTDLQMLDRLSAGLVTLPSATYDLILVLTDVDGTHRAEALALLADRDVFGRVAQSLKAGGTLRSEDGTLGKGDENNKEVKEAILAGLVAGGQGFVKPEEEEAVVPLRFGGKKSTGVKSSDAVNDDANGSAAKSLAGPAVGSATVTVNGKATKVDLAPPAVKPAGVGFVDFSDDLDLDDDDDDDIIDEDTLLDASDLKRPIRQRMLSTSLI
jgi:anamorsin